MSRDIVSSGDFSNDSRHCHSFCHAPFHNNNAVFVTGQHPLPQLENSLWSQQHLLQYNVIVGTGLIIRWEGGKKICCSHVLTANCRVQNRHTRRCKRGKHRQALETDLIPARSLLNALSVFILGMVPGGLL